MNIGTGILFAVACCAWSPAQGATPAPRTLALLVGIADYATPENGEALGELKGPENDVVRAERLLVDRFGFDRAGIVTLKGKAATHEAIVTTFHRHLIAQAGPETRVVFWFSGHGSRIPDASGKDAAPRDPGDNAFDDTLLAWDSRAVDPRGSHDLADDELFSLLAALRSKDVVVITDCCHSGGVLRGGQRPPGVREGDHGTAPLDRARVDRFWPKAVPLFDDEQEKELPAVVHVAACSALDEAGEFKTASGTYGTLTWFLTQVLADVDPRASWSQVGAMVRARVAGHGTRQGQMVEVSGAVDRAVFGGSGRPVQPGFQVDRFGGASSKQLLIGGGTLHGLGLSAELELVDLDGKQLGTAKVTTVRATASTAEWQGGDAPPADAMRANPKTFGTRQALIRVLCRPGIDAALLEGIDIVAAVSDPVHADFLLAKHGDAFQLQDAAGEFVRDLGKDAAAVRVGLLKEHWFRSLWQGVAQAGRGGLRVNVEPATAEDQQRVGIPLAIVQPAAKGTAGSSAALVGAAMFDEERRDGGLVCLRVTNTGSENVHLAIVSVTEMREVHVVHGKNPNNVLAPGAELRKCVWVGPDVGWKQPRPMIDRYVVVATDRFADFTPFEQGPQSGPQRGGDEQRGATGEALPPLLRAAVGGATTRGPEPAAPAWGIAFCDLQLTTRCRLAVALARQELAAGRQGAASAHLQSATAAATTDTEKAEVAELRKAIERANGAGGPAAPGSGAGR